jgi:hypothetical protein
MVAVIAYTDNPGKMWEAKAEAMQEYDGAANTQLIVQVVRPNVPPELGYAVGQVRADGVFVPAFVFPSDVLTDTLAAGILAAWGLETGDVSEMDIGQYPQLTEASEAASKASGFFENGKELAGSGLLGLGLWPWLLLAAGILLINR